MHGRVSHEEKWDGMGWTVHMTDRGARGERPAPVAARRRRSTANGAGGVGDDEGRDRQEGAQADALSSLGRLMRPHRADAGVLPPHILGAFMGRDGADCLLRHDHWHHLRLHVLHGHVPGPVVPGFHAEDLPLPAKEAISEAEF